MVREGTVLPDSNSQALYDEPCSSFVSWNWISFVAGKSVQIICIFWRPSSLNFIKDPARDTGLGVPASPPHPCLSWRVCCGLQGMTGTLWATVYHRPCFLLLCHQQDLNSFSLFQLVNQEQKKEKIIIYNCFIFSMCKSMRIFFLFLINWRRVKVPLVTWGQEIWQMINCGVPTCTHT